MYAGWGHGRDKISFLTQVLGTYFTGSTFCSGTGLFSLSIGMGVLLTYASYIKKDENLTSISLQVICADTLIAVLAGIAIFPAVFAFNIAPDSGPGLVFLTLPQVFQSVAFRATMGDSFLSPANHGRSHVLYFPSGSNRCLFRGRKHISRRKATVISTVIVTIFGFYAPFLLDR